MDRMEELATRAGSRPQVVLEWIGFGGHANREASHIATAPLDRTQGAHTHRTASSAEDIISQDNRIAAATAARDQQRTDRRDANTADQRPASQSGTRLATLRPAGRLPLPAGSRVPCRRSSVRSSPTSAAGTRSNSRKPHENRSGAQIPHRMPYRSSQRRCRQRTALLRAKGNAPVSAGRRPASATRNVAILTARRRQIRKRSGR